MAEVKKLKILVIDDDSLILKSLERIILNGYETMVELKKIMPKCKYAIMTGYDVDEMVQKAQDEGACALLKKPFEITQINEVISMVKGTLK